MNAFCQLYHGQQNFCVTSLQQGKAGDCIFVCSLRPLYFYAYVGTAQNRAPPNSESSSPLFLSSTQLMDQGAEKSISLPPW